MADVPRPEYPRPDWVRDEWLPLNGEWRFDFDDENRGLRDGWFADASPLSRTIRVPFAYQTPASGIDVQDQHSIVWYAREFTIPAAWHGKRILLHFGAVDYEATVWVNGRFAGQHRGGYVPFRLDVTDLVAEGGNQVTVRVVDEPRTDQPRGKQTARREPWGCWYTPVTGIWQSVWLEPVPAIHLADAHLVPDIAAQCLSIRYSLSQVEDGLTLEASIFAEGTLVSRQEVPVPRAHGQWSDLRPLDRGAMNASVPSPRLWSPEKPFLYDLTLRLRRGGEVVDEVKTYFGMREIHAARGQIFLNNRPLYQRLVLDQGYWPEGLYTAPSVDAIRRDVELTKAMGFNGARKHQKIEDPYYYYFCDRLGLLVWSEMPACYEYSEAGAANLRQEWAAAVQRDRNHPSIIAWVPINESWGVDQLKGYAHRQAEAHLMALYYETHSLDGTRLVVSNDGWQQARTDLLTIHEYTQDAADLRARYARFRANRHAAAFSHRLPILLPDHEYDGAPILVTEFGGIKVEEQQAKGWGYGKAASDYGEMVERIRQLVDALIEQDEVVGYCYTQLTDVQQEVNGLLTFDHQPKVDPEKLWSAFRGRG